MSTLGLSYPYARRKKRWLSAEQIFYVADMSSSAPSFLLRSLPFLLLGSAVWAAPAIRYTTHSLSRTFYAEGAAAADVNKDGKTDIIYGPLWFEGPDWKKSHEIYAPVPFKPDNDYSKNFVEYAPDLNADGWPDYLVLGFPGDVAYWFENPQGKPGHWARHDILKVLDNESPTWGDLTGDGKPEIIGSSGGFFGYAQPNPADARQLWEFRRIANVNAAGGKFTHGLGFGDVNGDGRADLLEKNGWWEQPADDRLEWPQHKITFSKNGGSQMFAYDFDGDGDNDVLSAEHAHGYGLYWFENQGKEANGEIKFAPHRIMGATPEENAQGVVFSQLHAVDMADINGDGVKDIITGKRHFAHGSKGDADPLAPAVLYWFEVQPGKKSGEAKFVAHFIDDDSGVGTQVMATDVNGDGLQDIVVGSKKGCHVSVARKVTLDAEGFEPLFDGKSLQGWDADAKYWRVENGVVIGESTTAMEKNTFMSYRAGKLADFEFRAKFKLTGPPNANSGIQFRSQDQGNFTVVGYQADIDREGKYVGCLWDEHGRGMLADRGTDTVWNADGSKQETRKAERDALSKAIPMDEWNEYSITAQGSRITLRINGTVTAECTDLSTKDRDLYGVLALQLHSGPPSKIEWKDVRLRRF
jgi:hypothetical protein